MRLLRDNGLTIALMAAFAASLVGMAWSGLLSHNEELLRHHQAPIDLAAYLATGQFLSALFENWESEFLQMAFYVILTAYLFQRGSAESNDPDEPEEYDTPHPGWRQASPLVRGLWSHSLGIVLALLFLASFVLHWLSSVAAANAEAARHSEAGPSAVEFLGDAGLWFESFQNWQSEFLSTAVLVVLSIFLRYKGSPESKKLRQTDDETGA
jgi:glycerol uptake facilitator-like aquaporin